MHGNQVLLPTYFWVGALILRTLLYNLSLSFVIPQPPYLQIALVFLVRHYTMPVTRSVTRASELNAEKSTIKSTSKQQNVLHGINSTSMKINAKDPSAAETPPQSCRLIEWISLKDPPNGVVPNSDELFATLQEIHKLKECIIIARGRPRELSEIEWLIIGKQH